MKEPDNIEVKYKRIVAFVAVLLVLIGQLSLFGPIEELEKSYPIKIWISLIGVNLFLWNQIARPAPEMKKLFSRFPGSKTISWVLSALVLSILATLIMLRFEKYDIYNFAPVIMIWLLSGVCYLMAFRPDEFSLENMKNWLAKYNTEILFVVGITCLAAILRFYKLGTIPFIMDGDEGRLALVAQDTIVGIRANPFSSWENFGMLYLQLVNVAFTFFGAAPFALRFLPALSGTLAIPFTYLLARQITGRRRAVLASIFLAISHTHINFSRIGAVGYIHSTWLVPLELYLFLSAVEKRSAWRAALGGLVLVIHFYVYITAQIIIALLLVYTLLCFLFLRTWFRPAFRKTLAFWGGWAILFIPKIVDIAIRPHEFFSRLNADGVFQTGWLENTMASTGKSAIEILAGRISHAFFSLLYYPALDFYGVRVSMLGFILAVLFLLGLGIVLWRTRSPGVLLLNGYFWAPTLAIGLFAIPPSADSYRMLITLPPVMIIAAIGLDETLQIFGASWPDAKKVYAFWTTGVIASMLVFNLWTYFGDFASQCVYGDNLEGRFASYLGNYTNDIRSELSVYLLSDEDFFYGSHDSASFLNRRREIFNFDAPVSVLGLISGETVIAPPSRISELENWVRSHPGGELHYRYDCDNVILLAYQVP